MAFMSEIKQLHWEDLLRIQENPDLQQDGTRFIYAVYGAVRPRGKDCSDVSNGILSLLTPDAQEVRGLLGHVREEPDPPEELFPDARVSVESHKIASRCSCLLWALEDGFPEGEIRQELRQRLRRLFTLISPLLLEANRDLFEEAAV